MSFSPWDGFSAASGSSPSSNEQREPVSAQSAPISLSSLLLSLPQVRIRRSRCLSFQFLVLIVSKERCSRGSESSGVGQKRAAPCKGGLFETCHNE